MLIHSYNSLIKKNQILTFFPPPCTPCKHPGLLLSLLPYKPDFISAVDELERTVVAHTVVGSLFKAHSIPLQALNQVKQLIADVLTVSKASKCPTTHTHTIKHTFTYLCIL